MSPNAPVVWPAVISRLNRETQEGKLKWERSPARPPGTDIDELYLAQFKNWTVGVYNRSFKDYSDETDEWFTNTELRVGLFDVATNELLFTVPEKEGVYELFQAVQKQYAKADEFAQAILADDDDVPF